MVDDHPHSEQLLPDDLLHNARAVVFDAYGTLFDVGAAVARHAGSIGPHAARLSELWRTKQLEYSWVNSLAGTYVDFWTLTERALDYALARLSDVDPALKAELLMAYRVLDAYEDVVPTLTALRARGLATAILSNGSPSMLAEAIAAANLHNLLDAAISVEEAGIFKTSPRTYALIETRLGIAAALTVFVSSNRWDVAGASAFGLRAIWINRLEMPNEYPEFPPVAVVRSLTALVEA